MNYVDDVKMVLSGYRDKMESSNLKVSSIKTDLIFGNLEEIWEFHAAILLPHLESCHLNPTLIAKTFLEYSQQLTRMYCRSAIIHLKICVLIFLLPTKTGLEYFWADVKMCPTFTVGVEQNEALQGEF